MTKEQFEQAKAEINRHPLSDYYHLDPSPKAGPGMYNCPLCGSGTGEHHTGTLKMYMNDDGTFQTHCPKGCFNDGPSKSMSTLDALVKLMGKDPADVIRGLGLVREEQSQGLEWDATIGDPGDRDPAEPKPLSPSRQTQTQTAAPKPPADDAKDYTDDYKAWHEALMNSKEAKAYLRHRGITERAMEHFNLGYVPDWQYNGGGTKTPRIIIPFNSHFYKARRIDGKDDTAKYMPSGSIGDNIFNLSILDPGPNPDEEHRKQGGKVNRKNPEETPIIIVEGELNAIRLWEGADGVPYPWVLAQGAAGNCQAMVKAITENFPDGAYMLALDNDKETKDGKFPGQDGQKALAKALDAAKVFYKSLDTADLYGQYTDAGEALQDTDFGKTCMEKIYTASIEIRNEYKAARVKAEQEAYWQSGPGMVDRFLEKIRTRTYEPVSTGLEAVNRVLGGGITRQTITILGAAPGMGKTALASQICENMAFSGEDVLFFNLEMSREQLLARSIARIMKQRGEQAPSVGKILRGYELDNETFREVERAAGIYKNRIAGHLIYNPGQETKDLQGILDTVAAEKKRLGHAPILCVDYLQLLRTQSGDGRTDDSAETIKLALERLKDYAVRENSIVIIITANNRASNITGQSGLASGRDTSNIEYGADYHLGLEYSRLGEDLNGGKGKKNPVTLDTIEEYRYKYFEAMYQMEHGGSIGEFNEAESRYSAFCQSLTLRVNKGRIDSGGKAYLKFDGATASFQSCGKNGEALPGDIKIPWT